MSSIFNSVGWALRIAFPLVLCTLAACGWRLQGTARLPEVMAVTYIDAADRYSDFTRALRSSLQSSGVRLTEDRAAASAIVRVLADQSGQRVLSLSVRNTPEEYEVFYAVEYSVSTPQTELIEQQRLERTRDFSYDQTAVLAKQKEQGVLRAALAQELAGLVVRRLASL